MAQLAKGYSHMNMKTLNGWTIIFDLDGTLVDTAPDLAATLDQILTEEGLPDMGLDPARQFVGHGARALLKKGFAAAGVQLDQPREDQLVKRFIEIYKTCMSKGSKPFPGVLDCLQSARARGATLAVCTNKLTHMAEQLLVELNMHDHFVCVLGQDSVPNHKPDPGHVLATLKRAGGQVEKALFVGDSDADVRAAQAAGVPVWLYTHGYGVDAARACKPDHEFDDYKRLTTHLAAL